MSLGADSENESSLSEEEAGMVEEDELETGKEELVAPCDAVMVITSFCGADIKPLATKELKRFESGFCALLAVLNPCDEVPTRDEEGGGPGGSGGNSAFREFVEGADALT